jgi:hypothetical protein
MGAKLVFLADAIRAIAVYGCVIPREAVLG